MEPKLTMRVLKGHAAHTPKKVYTEGEIITGTAEELAPYLAQLEECTLHEPHEETPEESKSTSRKKGGS